VKSVLNKLNGKSNSTNTNKSLVNNYIKMIGEIRCKKCLLKTIFKSYREVCDKCADELKICSKCMQQKEIITVEKPYILKIIFKTVRIKRS
jgi:hypothetical protein